MLWNFSYCSLDGKESACNAGDLGSISGLERSPGEGNGQPTPVFLPREFHGQTMGLLRIRHDWANNSFIWPLLLSNICREECSSINRFILQIILHKK